MPKGIPTAGRRAPRGSKMRTGIIGFSSELGAERISTVFGTQFGEFDDGARALFSRVIRDWSKRIYAKNLKAAIRSSMWVRSGGLQKVNTRVSSSEEAGLATTFIASATFPDHTTEKQGIAQEFGRPAHGAKHGKYYMVPLASWVAKTGRPSAGSSKGSRKWKDTDEIYKDLEQKGVFWGKNYVATKAGPARMVYIYKKSRMAENKTGRYRDPVTGRFVKKPKFLKKRDKLGRKITRGRLKEIATAMYLAYSSATGIYGRSKSQAKAARGTKNPLAAQFGLTVTASRNAPMWFTRGAIASLGRLASAVNKVRVRAEAMNMAVFGEEIFRKLEGELGRGEESFD